MIVWLNLDKPIICVFVSTHCLHIYAKTTTITEVALDVGFRGKRLHLDTEDVIGIITIDVLEETSDHPILVDEIVDAVGNIALVALVTIKIKLPPSHLEA